MDEKTNDVDVVALQNDIALLKQEMNLRDETIKKLTDDKSNLLKLNQRLQLAVGVSSDAPQEPAEKQETDFDALRNQLQTNTLTRLFNKK